MRGYEVEKGRYVVFTDDELEAATARGGSKIVDVVQFVETKEIDPIFYRSSYYLVPEKTGLKAYRILLQALREKDRVGIAKFALREKEYLATLRADENVLILETMFWPDEIRAPAFEELETEIEVRKEEVKMAEMIIDNLTSPFDADAYQDPTRGAIEELARKKIEGEEIVSPETPEPTKVLDLLEALKASVEATKERRAAS